jgi:hypothetical protein
MRPRSLVFAGVDDATEPKLVFVRNQLTAEADQADARAAWLDGYLQRGDALAGDVLAVLVGQLEPLPEAAETVAA